MDKECIRKNEEERREREEKEEQKRIDDEWRRVKEMRVQEE